MREKFVREIFYYKDYYLDFWSSLGSEVQMKFNWTLQLIASLERVPEKYFKHMSGTRGLYEIRVEVGSDIFRVFSFFDEGSLIILITGFQKKSQKAPRNEIKRAEMLKKEYFHEKDQS